VYWEIEQYRWIAQLGKRVLKPYGYCIAECGTYFLHDVLNAMAESLDYYWLIQEDLTLPTAFFKYRIAQLHKPFAWFANGIQNSPDRQYMIDRVHSTKDKRYHQWGDGVGTMLPIIERLTKPGNVILDPFCGGGTVPVACQRTGRRYVGFEIDAEKAASARQRIVELPPLLPFAYQSVQEYLFDGASSAQVG